MAWDPRPIYSTYGAIPYAVARRYNFSVHNMQCYLNCFLGVILASLLQTCLRATLKFYGRSHIQCVCERCGGEYLLTTLSWVHYNDWSIVLHNSICNHNLNILTVPVLHMVQQPCRRRIQTPVYVYLLVVLVFWLSRNMLQCYQNIFRNLERSNSWLKDKYFF